MLVQQNEFEYEFEFYKWSSNFRKKTNLTSLVIYLMRIAGICWQARFNLFEEFLDEFVFTWINHTQKRSDNTSSIIKENCQTIWNTSDTTVHEQLCKWQFFNQPRQVTVACRDVKRSLKIRASIYEIGFKFSFRVFTNNRFVIYIQRSVFNQLNGRTVHVNSYNFSTGGRQLCNAVM